MCIRDRGAVADQNTGSMLAVVAIGITIHRQNRMYITTHIGQMLGKSRTIGVLTKISSKAVDIGGIYIRHIIGDFVCARTQLVGSNGCLLYTSRCV